MTQTIWIVGALGRMGSELLKHLKNKQDYKIIETDQDVDITDLHAVDQAIDVYRPTIVINCASISDVEYCEQNMVEAFKVNAIGARNLAIASRRINAKMVQLSTDDVFDGMTEGSHTEFDIPKPCTVYGKSKLAGENYVKELNPKHIIIRSSWVYGQGKGDYFEYVVRNGASGAGFEAPTDRISTPTSASLLADFIERILEKTEYGIFHASCEGQCTRYEFAQKILELMEFDSKLVQGKEFEENGKVTCTILENLMMKLTGVYVMPDWITALTAYTNEIKGKGRK